MILIFVSEITTRIEYTFEFIFNSRAIDFQLTTDRTYYSNYSGLKLNYSEDKLNGVQIKNSSICFESGIIKKVVEWDEKTDWKCLSIDGVVDPIASIFYILSRYEEYSCSIKDVHGRFPYKASILSIENRIEKLNCERWAVEVIRYIDKNYLKLEEVVTIIPTFDIDNTFAYKLKTGRRMLLSLIKDVFQGNKNRIKERSEVLNGAKDPYDTFDKIAKVGSNFPQTLVFWLVGERAKMDRNISIDNVQHQAVIRSISEFTNVNLHPSYASNSKVESITIEKEKLASVLGKKVTKSRQHFLKFELPKTYTSLIDSGLNDEYSMGFAEHVGFRSGTARPHKWFDLSEDKCTSLIIHPFAYMDGTLNEYMNLSIDQSKSTISSLYKEVKEFGGDFIFLWHNETIGDYGKWSGWSSVLEHTLNLKHE